MDKKYILFEIEFGTSKEIFVEGFDDYHFAMITALKVRDNSKNQYVAIINNDKNVEYENQRVAFFEPTKYANSLIPYEE
jgi:hypothetical protein